MAAPPPPPPQTALMRLARNTSAAPRMTETSSRALLLVAKLDTGWGVLFPFVLDCESTVDW
eukprot:c38790_g1_i1 orf=58-240(+)